MMPIEELNNLYLDAGHDFNGVFLKCFCLKLDVQSPGGTIAPPGPIKQDSYDY